jgi:SAM-dependent methyltransferase
VGDVSATAFAYDEVRYDTGTQESTRPALLQTMASLHGIRAASPSRCRVLELGGGSGLNMLPIAAAYPDSEFVIVDLAASAIAMGRAFAEEAALRNVTLRQGDITEPLQLGAFDYVIAHGVYSWIPDAVRTHLLAAARRHLTPAGVFYISYNAQPGWQVMGALRDLMEFHVRGETDPPVRVNRAMDLVGRIAALETTTAGFASALRATAISFLRVVAHARKPGDAFNHFVFHDALAETNDAFYLREVAERALTHGLTWFSSAAFVRPRARESFDELYESLRGATSLPRSQAALYVSQFDDLLAGTRFRRDLFARSDAPGEHAFSIDAVGDLFATWRGAPPELTADWRLVRGSTVDASTFATSPVGVAAIEAVHRAAPGSVRVRDAIDGDVDAEARRTAHAELLRAWSARAIDLAVETPAFARKISRTPRVSAFVRAAARRHVADGLREPCNVVNAFHETYVFPAEVSTIVANLDGAHDRRALRESLGADPRADAFIEEALRDLLDVAALLD